MVNLLKRVGAWNVITRVVLHTFRCLGVVTGKQAAPCINTSGAQLLKKCNMLEPRWQNLC